MTPITNPFAPRRHRSAIVDTGIRYGKTIDEIDQDWVMQNSCKMYAFCNLVWQDVDTLITSAGRLHLDATKKISRRIRQLKQDYDRFRHHILGDSEEYREEERAVRFEDIFADDFQKLYYAASNQAGRLVDPEQRRYLVALYRATVTCRAVQIASKRADKKLHQLGIYEVPDDCMLQLEMTKLFELIPRFQIPPFRLRQDIVELNAGILANRFQQLSVQVAPNNINLS
jgi:hypothetical protein